MGRWFVVGLQVLLALAFAASGVQKLAGALEPMREHLGVAPWFWALTALVELAGAAGMLAGLRSARVAAFSGGRRGGVRGTSPGTEKGGI